MPRLLAALTVLVCVVPIGNAQDVKKDLAKLDGTWALKELKYDGNNVEKDDVKFKFVFKGDQGTVEGNDDTKKEYGRFTVKLDPRTTPKTIDIKITAFKKDVTLVGIYKMKGDELKICVEIVGNDRPSEFAAPQGSSTAYVVLMREK